MSVQFKDYYETLGVPRNAKPADIEELEQQLDGKRGQDRNSQ